MNYTGKQYGAYSPKGLYWGDYSSLDPNILFFDVEINEL